MKMKRMTALFVAVVMAALPCIASAAELTGVIRLPETVENGSFTVTRDGSELHNGDAIASGDKLTIEAVPNEGFVQISGTQSGEVILGEQTGAEIKIPGRPNEEFVHNGSWKDTSVSYYGEGISGLTNQLYNDSGRNKKTLEWIAVQADGNALPTDKEVTLYFDWGVSQGYAQYGTFQLTLYHNDGVAIQDLHDQNNVMPYNSVESESYSFTPSETGDTFKWEFYKTGSGSWADAQGRPVVLSNVHLSCDTGYYEPEVPVFKAKRTVTIGSFENASLTVNGEAMVSGGSVVIPDGNRVEMTAEAIPTETADYIVKGITVTDESGAAVEVIHENGTYAFTMPNANVTITPVIEEFVFSGEISTKDELLSFINIANQRPETSARLMCDIDMEGAVIEPICPAPELIYNSNVIPYKGYLGTFDGNGHKISNFTIKKDSAHATAGLFGTVSGQITNLTIANATFNNKGEYDGRFSVLCGQLLTGGVIDGCVTANSKVYTSSKIGGAIVGANYGGTVKNSVSWKNNITAHSRIGDLIGDNRNDNSTLIGTAINCCSTGNAIGEQSGNKTNIYSNMKNASEVAWLLNTNCGTEENSKVWSEDGYPCRADETHKPCYSVALVHEGAAEPFGRVYGKAGDTVTIPYKGSFTMDGQALEADANGNCVLVMPEAEGTASCEHCYDNGFCVGGEAEYEVPAQDENGVYQIANGGQLYWFAALVNGELEGVERNSAANAVLTKDITVNNLNMSTNYNDLSYTGSEEGVRKWRPIGAYNKEAGAFYAYRGTFDGQNHTINGLFYNNTEALVYGAEGNEYDYVGLFGVVYEGTVQNITVANSYFRAPYYAAGIAAYAVNSTIKNATSNAHVKSFVAGGIVSAGDGGVITGCTQGVSMYGSSIAGGIVGFPDQGMTIEKCRNQGRVLGGENCGGGIAGQILGDATVKTSYNTGMVNVKGTAGGIAGGGAGSIEGCYNRGETYGKTTFPICGGEETTTTVTNCCYLADTAGEDGQMTREQFENGEAAYRLGEGWGQMIGRNSYPIWDGEKVFKVTYINGDTTEETYTNKKLSLKAVPAENTCWAKENGEIAKNGEILTEDITLTLKNMYTVTVNGGLIGSGNTVTASEGQSVTITPDEAIAGFVADDGSLVLPNENGEIIYTVTKDATLTGKSLGISLLNGAQVRVGAGLDAEGKITVTDGLDGSGLRFVGEIDRNETLASYMGENDKIYVAVTAEGSDKTVRIPIELYQSDSVFTAALVNLKVANYNRVFTARVEAEINGSVVVGNEVSRSVYEVSAGLLTDGAESEVTKTISDVLNAYVNQVGIRLLIQGDSVTADSAYSGKVFFDVTSEKDANGVYTITITPIGQAKTADYWNEYIRINNNNSEAKKYVTAQTSESGSLVITFDPKKTN